MRANCHLLPTMAIAIESNVNGGVTVAARDQDFAERQPWIEPEIRVLDLAETSADPGPGADVAGNPSPDCQLS
jgi:hypothetical protein